MVPDPADEAQPAGLGASGGTEVDLDTSEVSRASQKVDLDLDDAPFLEEEEEVKPEPPKAKEAVSLAADDAEKPAPRDKKKLIIIGAGALVVVLALGLAVKFFFFKGKQAPPPDIATKTAVQQQPKVEAPEPERPEVQVRMEPFWVEQKGEKDEVRFLIARILLITHDEKVAKEFEGRLMPARNAIFYYLKNKDVQFLADEKNTEKLKTELLLVANQHVSDGKFEMLMFEEYVVK